MSDLFEAISRDECERLTRLIEASSLEQTNNGGFTPLQAACLSQSVECTKMLLDAVQMRMRRTTMDTHHFTWRRFPGRPRARANVICLWREGRRIRVASKGRSGLRTSSRLDAADGGRC